MRCPHCKSKITLYVDGVFYCTFCEYKTERITTQERERRVQNKILYVLGGLCFTMIIVATVLTMQSCSTDYCARVEEIVKEEL